MPNVARDLYAGAVVTRQALAAVIMVTVFGATLLGVPSCTGAADPSTLGRRRVERLIAAQQFAEALPLAVEERAHDPVDPVAAWHVARIYQGLAMPADEAVAWELYLRQSPPTGDVCLRLADVYHDLHQPAQVAATINRCLALDDQQAELLGQLAAAYLEMGNRAAAIDSLQRALVIDPAHPQFRADLDRLQDEER
jgi:tetratricopeptide (TPR) repeat protein